MQTCKNCQSIIPDDIRSCPYCGSPVQNDDNDARKRLLLRLRASTLASSLVATVSAGAFVTYIIASTLILGYALLGVFLRPPVILIVTPLTLDFGKVEIGHQAVQPVMLKTNRDSQPAWKIVSGNPLWLSISLSNETKEPGNLSEVDYKVMANTTALTAGPYSAVINFTSNGGNTSVGVKLYVVAAPKGPEILGVNPSSGLNDGGTTVVITGTGFAAAATTVSFGTVQVAASDVTVNSDTQITVISPPANSSDLNSTIDVSVRTPIGTSAIGPADHFAYYALPSPPMLGISPTYIDTYTCPLSTDQTLRRCSVTLTNQSSSVDLPWSATSNSGQSSIVPPSQTIAAGSTEMVEIDVPDRTSDTITFTGPGNSVTVMLTYSPPQLGIDSTNINTYTCPLSTDQTFRRCNVTLTNQSSSVDLPWSAISNSGQSSIVAPSQTIAAGSTEMVEIDVPVKLSSESVTFTGPVNNVTVTLMYSPPVLTVSSTIIVLSQCPLSTDQTLRRCSVTLTNQSSSVDLPWSATSDSGQSSIVAPSQTIAAGGTESVEIDVPVKLSFESVTFTGPVNNVTVIL